MWIFVLGVLPLILVNHHKALGHEASRPFCPELADIQDTVCESFSLNYSCVGSCGDLRVGEHQYELCACDSECVTYGDCCSDCFEECSHVVDEERFEGSINAGRCVQTNYPYNGRSTNLIGLCHPAWQDDVTKELCQNRSGLIGSLPTQGTKDNMSYINMYCAMCNFQDFNLWQMKFQCTEPLPTNFTVSMVTVSMVHPSVWGFTDHNKWQLIQRNPGAAKFQAPGIQS